MTRDRNDISFDLVYCENRITVTTYQGEYRNLMELIKDKLVLEDFGECKGIGRCGTCMVTIKDWKFSEPVKERNEERTLANWSTDTKEVRLSCQIMVNRNLDGSCVNL